jgi:hypothetical protein
MKNDMKKMAIHMMLKLQQCSFKTLQGLHPACIYAVCRITHFCCLHRRICQKKMPGDETGAVQITDFFPDDFPG